MVRLLMVLNIFSMQLIQDLKLSVKNLPVHFSEPEQPLGLSIS